MIPHIAAAAAVAAHVHRALETASNNLKITKWQLREIIKEEKARLLNEVDFVDYDVPRVQEQAYSKLEDLLMTNLPQFVDDLRAEEFATFEKVVMDAMAELKDRTVKNYSGERV